MLPDGLRTDGRTAFSPLLLFRHLLWALPAEQGTPAPAWWPPRSRRWLWYGPRSGGPSGHSDAGPCSPRCPAARPACPPQLARVLACMWPDCHSWGQCETSGPSPVCPPPGRTCHCPAAAALRSSGASVFFLLVPIPFLGTLPSGSRRASWGRQPAGWQRRGRVWPTAGCLPQLLGRALLPPREVSFLTSFV